MKLIQHIFLYLAFGLLLLHSLVPHHHHDQSGCQDTALSEHASEVFALFHPTLEEGHLEHFFPEEAMALLLQVALPEWGLYLPQPGSSVTLAAIFPVSENQLISCSTPTCLQLRAPPAFA